MRILGYAGRLSVPPGEEIEFKVSTCEPRFRADLVRLLRGGVPGRTSPPVEEPVTSTIAGEYPGHRQPAHAGSYVHGRWRGPVCFPVWTAAAWIWPTTPGPTTVQGILATTGHDGRTHHALALTPSGVGLLGPDGSTLAATDAPPHDHEWCFVTATHDPDRGEIVLTQTPLGGRTQRVRVAVPHTPIESATGAITGAVSVTDGPAGCFNGKIAAPVLLTRTLGDTQAERLAAARDLPTATRELGEDVAMAWDFSDRPGTLTVLDRGPAGLTGRCVNMPTRAMTGPHWTGAQTDFRQAPEQYDAIHFHDDDFGDCGWDTDVRYTVPADLASGVYALRVHAGSDTDRIPFVVRETLSTAGHIDPVPVLVLLPTWTYLAYANWRTYLEELDDRTVMYGEERLPGPADYFLVEHPELGLSMYDHHSDGSGVSFSSRLRPILNMRPDYYTPTTKGLRHFAADLALIWWLEQRGVPYAVATDDDLHTEGLDLLHRHRVVLTGSHPEYCSAAMLDAIDTYTHTGGRLMYLGGNGFYWVTAPHPNTPHNIEIRRGAGAVRVWNCEPGEEHLAGTGEPGGLWRYRGRAPQRIAGVGMTAQGFDKASGYRRSPDSGDPAVSWIFDGVGGEVFGTVGEGLGGAAGDEIDRADPVLGTPRDAWVLASSFGHSDNIVLAVDEKTRAVSGASVGGPTASNKRSDIVAFGRDGGGAVFSVGSIAWLSALAYADGDNDVARITANVLDRFTAEPPPISPHP